MRFVPNLIQFQKKIISNTKNYCLLNLRCFNTSSSKLSNLNTTATGIIITRYNELVQNKLINYDDHQFKVVLKLNEFYNKIVEFEKPNKGIFVNFKESILKKYSKKKNLEQPLIKSLYVYGGVGLYYIFVKYF